MKTLLAVLLLASINSFSQSQSGVILNEQDKTPVPFAKIGIEGRGIGTISDEKGNFALIVDSKYGNDLVRFSCPGYSSYAIKVTDYLHMDNKTILLQKKHIPPGTPPPPNEHLIRVLGKSAHSLRETGRVFLLFRSRIKKASYGAIVSLLER